MHLDHEAAATRAALRRHASEAQRALAAEQTAKALRMREDDLAMRARTIALRRASGA